jgi:hypothetical protein
LGKCYHIGGVELLGKVHHCVSIVLLITWTSTGEESAEGVDSYRVAVLTAIRSILTVTED